jgi:hypothetical protein
LRWLGFESFSRFFFDAVFLRGSLSVFLSTANAALQASDRHVA